MTSLLSPPKKDNSASKLAARQAKASAARQLAATAREAASADKASGKRGRKVPGADAFSFLTGPVQKLGQ